MKVDYTLIDVSFLNIQLEQKLDAVQSICASQIIITDAFRTKEQEIKMGGTGNGAHTRGLAVDIRCKDDQTRFNILQALILYGFKRIGIEADHIHADIDKSLANNVLWRV